MTFGTFRFVVTELMETDLQRIIMSSQQLTSDHIKMFMYQILRGKKEFYWVAGWRIGCLWGSQFLGTPRRGPIGDGPHTCHIACVCQSPRYPYGDPFHIHIWNVFFQA